MTQGYRKTVLVAAAVLLAAGCRDKKNTLRPVGEPPSDQWTQMVIMPTLNARFRLHSKNKFYRDDGIYEGNLNIHTRKLRTEFIGGTVTVTGKPAKGMVADCSRADGTRCVAVYGLSTGNPVRDRARREGLRVAAVIKLGMREQLERHFRQLGFNLQFATLSDRDLVTLAEAYSLDSQGFPKENIEDFELRRASEMLMLRGGGSLPPVKDPRL